jgi:diguanylate cyclase (GGDEF)-like protein
MKSIGNRDTDPPPPVSETALSVMRRDPIVRLAGFALALAVIPYFLPWLDSEHLAIWSALYSELPLLLVCLVAFQFRLRRLDDPRERRFWTFWTLAMSAWLLKSLVAMWFDSRDIWTLQADLILNSCYFLFYAFVAVALETRPWPRVSRQVRLAQVVERVGTLVFFFGLLLYFAIIPAYLDPSAYERSSLLLFVALDFYLVVRLTALRRDAPGRVWQRVYGWLLVTAALWLITDTFEMLMWAEVLPWVEDGTLLDLFWYPAYVTLVVAARVRETPVPTEDSSQPPTGFHLGPLIWFSVSFPVIHFSLARLGFATPELSPSREILTLALLIALAAMVVIHAELLRAENRRLERERARSQERIEHLAYHDDLTGLPNRRLLTDRITQALSRARRYGWHLAILLIDVDRFKTINDSLGHTAGDDLLCQLAGRLRRSIRENDTVARIGGDEFVAVIEGLKSGNDAARATEQVTVSLGKPYEIEGNPVTMTSTVGCAIYPDQGETLEDLLEEADADMYRKKSQRAVVANDRPAAD